MCRFAIKSRSHNDVCLKLSVHGSPFNSTFVLYLNLSNSNAYNRVQPYISLNHLRDHIEEQLGPEVVPEDYVFLRSVGRCMAVVSSKRMKHVHVHVSLFKLTPEIKFMKPEDIKICSRKYTKTTFVCFLRDLRIYVCI